MSREAIKRRTRISIEVDVREVQNIEASGFKAINLKARENPRALSLLVIFLTALAFSPRALASRAPASEPSCEEGHWLDENGKRQPKDDPAKPRIHCPQNCFNRTNVPGFTESDPGTFSRHQDTIGQCNTFTTTDFIGYNQKALKIFANDPDYQKGYSALDLELFAFIDAFLNKTGKRVLERDQFTIDEFLGKEIAPGKYEPLLAIHNAPNLFQIARKYGLCAESLFPSDYSRSNFRDLRDLLKKFRERLREKKKSGLTEAQATLIGMCPECRAIAPGLNNEQWAMVGQLVDEISDLDKQDMRVLVKINRLACPNEKRIQLPGGLGVRRVSLATQEEAFYVDKLVSETKNVNPLDYLERKNVVAVINYPARMINPQLMFTKDGRKLDDSEIKDDHSSLLVGTRTAMEGNRPVCYFVLKNSWGPTMCAAINKWFDAKSASTPALRNDPEFKNGSGIKCGEDGSFLVSHDRFFQYMNRPKSSFDF